MKKETKDEKVRTIRDNLFGCVNFEVPDEGVDYVLEERDIKGDVPFMSTDKKTRELLKADLYVWICLGPSKTDSISESDNGWSHKGGGYTLTDDDKDRMLQWAKSIYEKYDVELPFDDSVLVTISSFGVMPCNYNEAGIPLPHVETL